jgi:hypothetical protein
MDELNESLQKIGQHIYSGGPDGGPSDAPSPDGAESPKSEEEDVVDAEYKEV